MVKRIKCVLRILKILVVIFFVASCVSNPSTNTMNDYCIDDGSCCVEEDFCSCD
jgi:uncharacterized lipoprotein YajG